MAVTYESLIATIPALSDLDSAVVAFALTTAATMISEDFFEDDYNTALTLLAAHLATSLSSSSSAGSVTKEKVGDLETTYGALSVGDDYDATSYGKQFKLLRAKYVITPILNTSSCL